MRNVVGVIWLGVALLAMPTAQAESAKEASWQPVVLPAAQQTELRSANGHRYRIFISVPSIAPPEEGYPVLYVLDANAAFPVAAFLARSAVSRRDVTGHRPPLVVGIGYPGDTDFDVDARRRDYTLMREATDISAKEGGADRFLDFIEKELKPFIAAKYSVDTKRQALFGHSFGGLFVLHALFTRPSAFSTYLASSPSIWWQDKLVLTELPGLLVKTKSGAAPRVQISVGALEDQPRKGNYSAETLAMLSKRPMVSEARNLAATFKADPVWAERVRYYELEGEDHGPAWLPAMTRGMQFFLEQP